MSSYAVILISVLAVFSAILLANNRENFDGAGLVYNVPPEWFRKKKAYDLRDWIVSYNPDQLAHPGGCDMHYRGDPQELNWYSSAYRFFRM
jgi:hypothetical protein